MKFRLVLLVALQSPLVMSALADTKSGADSLAQKIDARIGAGHRANNITPAPRSSDAEFLRRVYLDLVGVIPPVHVVREFLADSRPDKRARMVESLLKDHRFARHFANVWRREWLPQTTSNPQLQFFGPGFEEWLQTQFAANVPYDAMVRSVLTAPPQSERMDQSPAAFLQVNELKPESIASAASRLFLGVKLECAQCHNHPFETWTRQQFWEFTAFFAGLQPVSQARLRRFPVEAIETRSIVVADLKKTVNARFLDGKQPVFKEKVSSRVTLADWMTASENPYFSQNAVNRLWAYFFGIGLIDPIDEPGENNPPSHPELLAEMSQAFRASRYDLRGMIRSIVMSETYQRSSAAPGASASADRTFARMKVRGLTPEQLFDSVAAATGYRDVPLPQRRFAFQGGPRGDFLSKFNTTERPVDVQTSILQALTLMNGRFLADQTDAHRSEILAAVINTPFMTVAEKIETLFLVALGRVPSKDEAEKLSTFVEKRDPARAFADIFWAILNSSEFGFNH